MPVSKAFQDVVLSEALGEYRVNLPKGELEASWRLSSAAIDRLVKIGMANYGYSNERSVREDIHTVRPISPFSPADSLNLGKLKVGDVVLLRDEENDELEMIQIDVRKFRLLKASQGLLTTGDILIPVKLYAKKSGVPLYFAVERDGFRYPSSSRFFRFGPLTHIGVCANTGRNKVSGKLSQGKRVGCFQKGYALHLGSEGYGFDPESIVSECGAAPFVLQLTEPGGGIFGFNPEYKFDFTNDRNLRERHQELLDEVLSVCEIEGDEVPKGIGKIRPVGFGVVKVGRRSDGRLWLEIIHKAKISTK